ncbi:hypothetical protein X801_05299, partial [Opisthorchis viverrini]
MGSCASTGVSQVESPKRSLTVGSVNPAGAMSPSRTRASHNTAKGFDQNHLQHENQLNYADSLGTSVDLLVMGRGCLSRFARVCRHFFIHLLCFLRADNRTS